MVLLCITLILGRFLSIGIEGMDKNMPYKEIYKLAKSRVIAFAEIIGKSHVHSLALENKND